MVQQFLVTTKRHAFHLLTTGFFALPQHVGFFKKDNFVTSIDQQLCQLMSDAWWLLPVGFRKENKTSRATSKPSPVVANLPKIMCPDCSPPKLKLNFFIFSFTYLSPTLDLKNLIFSFFKNFSKP